MKLVEKLTLTPDDVSAADVQAVRDAGVSDEAIEDAMHVCAGFSIITRIADALEFQVPDAAGFSRSAKSLLSRGYSI